MTPKIKIVEKRVKKLNKAFNALIFTFVMFVMTLMLFLFSSGIMELHIISCGVMFGEIILIARNLYMVEYFIRSINRALSK